VSEEAIQTGPDEGTDDYTPHPHRWRILTVSLVIGFMALLDVSIVNVAIPTMRSGLHTSSGAIQWVVSGYALAFGLTLVAGGRLGDAYGRRRLMLTGLLGFVVTSAAVGLAPNAALVITARLLQGASAGLLTPQNSGLIQSLFRGSERGKAFGLFGLTVSVSAASGPVLGGLIIALAGTADGWRYLFLINVPIGIVAAILVMRLVPKRLDRPGSSARIDLIGAVLLGATVLALLYPVVRVEGNDYKALPLLIGVPLFGWGFVRWERRLVATGRQPLLDVSLLSRLPGYANGMGVGALYFTGYTGILLVLSVYFQEQLGLSALHAGLLMAPFAVGSSISAPLTGRVVTRAGRIVTVLALAVTMAGTTVAAILIPHQGGGTLWLVCVPTLFFTGLGGGGVISPNMTLSLSEVPPRMGGAAGGALQTGQRIGTAIGAAILMTVYGYAGRRVSSAASLRITLLTAVVLLGFALLMALRALRSQVHQGTPSA